MSTQSFADLGVSSAVSGALAKRGFTEPFATGPTATRSIRPLGSTGKRRWVQAWWSAQARRSGRAR